MMIRCPKCGSSQMTKGRKEFPCRLCGMPLQDPRIASESDSKVLYIKVSQEDLKATEVVLHTNSREVRFVRQPDGEKR